MKLSEILVESLDVTPSAKVHFKGMTVVAIYVTHSQVESVHGSPFGLEVCQNLGPKRIERIRQALLSLGLPDIRDFHGSRKTEEEIRQIINKKN